MEISAINARNSGEIERATASLASLGNAGLIVTPSSGVSMHRDLIIQLAARHKLPAVYGNRNNINDGGLIFYGPNRIDQFRRAAGYVDRVLKGEKPADLPVQAPTKYDLVINLKTLRKPLALNFRLPSSLGPTVMESRRGLPLSGTKRTCFLFLSDVRFGGEAENKCSSENFAF